MDGRPAESVVHEELARASSSADADAETAVSSVPSRPPGADSSDMPPADVVEALMRSARPLIVGHVRPDGDCLGSILALAATITSPSCGPCVFYRTEQVSRRLAFLCDLVPHRLASGDETADRDLVVALDTAQIDRAAIDPPLATWAARGVPILTIDHHVGNSGFGTSAWIVPSAGSTCELVYRLLTAMGLPIRPAVASLLYAGIHTDTHGFSLSNTRAASLEIGGALVRAGADVARLCERLWRAQQKRDFDLTRLLYDNTRVTPDGLIAYSTASHAEITGVGCSAADIDDQVSIPRSIEGIRMAILFTEGRPGRVRINLRGENGTRVLELARTLGGGGHAESAGAIVDGPIEAAVARVLDLATASLAGDGPAAP